MIISFPRRARLARVILATCVFGLLTSCSTPERDDSAKPANTPARTVVVKLIAFNDFHGNINPPLSRTRVPDPAQPGSQLELPTGGVLYLSTLIGELKRQNEHSVVVAAGDLIGASPLVSSLFHHEPSIELLSKAGLDFSSVGNHEFDAGRVELLRMQNGGCLRDTRRVTCANGRFTGATFKYLAANVIDTSTARPLFPAYAIREMKLARGKTVKIGFIGLVTAETADLVMPSGISGLSFIDEATAANAAVPELRAQGVETIAILIHEGGYIKGASFDDATCPEFTGHIKGIADRLDPAIDLIVSGHTHRSYICRYGPRLITSAGSEGRILTDIDLTIDTRTGDVVASTARQLAVVNDTAPNPLPTRYPTLARDPQLIPLVNLYNEKTTPLANRELCKITTDIVRRATHNGESALGTLIADAQLFATRAAGAQISFMNVTGVRTDFKADHGAVTYGDAFAVHPFGNRLITLSLTGEQLHALLEHQWAQEDDVLAPSSNFTYAWDAAAPRGKRIDVATMQIDGVAIESAKTYRVTLNEFLAQGGDGYKVLASGTDRVPGALDIEALEKYVVANSPISAPVSGRIVRRN